MKRIEFSMQVYRYSHLMVLDEITQVSKAFFDLDTLATLIIKDLVLNKIDSMFNIGDTDVNIYEIPYNSIIFDEEEIINLLDLHGFLDCEE